MQEMQTIILPVNLKKINPQEYTILPDEGCAVSPSCLNCIFPKCKYDMTQREKMDYGIIAIRRRRSRVA